MYLDQLKCLCPEFRDSIYDFNRIPDSREVREGLVAYDNRLFFLWNRMHNRWELWRWKQDVLPHHPSSEREIYDQAALQHHDVPADMRLIRNLPGADLWRMAGTNDPDKTAETREKEADAATLKDRNDVKKSARDLVEDNVKILRREVGDMFRAYYPPDRDKGIGEDHVDDSH